MHGQMNQVCAIAFKSFLRGCGKIGCLRREFSIVIMKQILDMQRAQYMILDCLGSLSFLLSY